MKFPSEIVKYNLKTLKEMRMLGWLNYPSLLGLRKKPLLLARQGQSVLTKGGC
jgi:hypothetical protein